MMLLFQARAKLLTSQQAPSSSASSYLLRAPWPCLPDFLSTGPSINVPHWGFLFPWPLACFPVPSVASPGAPASSPATHPLPSYPIPQPAMVLVCTLIPLGTFFLGTTLRADHRLASGREPGPGGPFSWRLCGSPARAACVVLCTW